MLFSTISEWNYAASFISETHFLKPALSLEIKEQSPGQGNQDCPENKVAVFIVQFRQILKVCTINKGVCPVRIFVL